VGDEPAVTKVQKTLDLNPQMTLTDTPGLMWPKIRYDSDGYMLAASHAIGINEVDEEDVAAFLGDLLLARYPALLTARYGFATDALDWIGLIEAIARRRGCQLKGGGLDMEKASIVLLHDYRTGKLGRISLETPQTRLEMVSNESEAPAPPTSPPPLAGEG